MIILEEIQSCYTGNRFKAVSDTSAGEEVECIPVIYRKGFASGLKIMIENGEHFFSIEQDYLDLPKLFRVAEILSVIKKVDPDLVSAAFLAADRMSQISSLGFSPPLSNLISSKDLRKIMLQPVPEEIVEQIKGIVDISPKGKEALKQELIAGTILYDQRMSDLGILNPQAISEEELRKKNEKGKIYYRIKKILDSYFEYMWVEEEVKELVINDAIGFLTIPDLKFRDQLAVALGGFVAISTYYKSLNTAEGKIFSDALLADMINEIIIDSIYWFSSEIGCSLNEAAEQLDQVCDNIISDCETQQSS